MQIVLRDDSCSLEVFIEDIRLTADKRNKISQKMLTYFNSILEDISDFQIPTSQKLNDIKEKVIENTCELGEIDDVMGLQPFQPLILTNTETGIVQSITPFSLDEKSWATPKPIMITDTEANDIQPISPVVPEEQSNTVLEESETDTSTVPLDWKNLINTDSAGVKWDPALHSSKKSLKKDGTWRPKKGVTVSPTVLNTPVPPAKSIPLPPASTSSITLTQLVNKITSLIKDGKLTTPQVIQMHRSMGIEQLTELTTQPDLLTQLYFKLDLVTNGI